MDFNADNTSLKYMNETDIMTKARHLAAQCWCDPETEDREMDATLAEAMAKRLAVLMQRIATAEASKSAKQQQKGNK